MSERDIQAVVIGVDMLSKTGIRMSYNCRECGHVPTICHHIQGYIRASKQAPDERVENGH